MGEIKAIAAESKSAAIVTTAGLAVQIHRHYSTILGAAELCEVFLEGQKC